ncbi:MAG TPA: hypothetical protein VGM88_08240 [Kofleriaceae bacterium]|jgi:serine/threonine-protein kinase
MWKVNVLTAWAVGCGVAGVAFAQANPQAEALFRDGKQLMKDGKTGEACTAFEGSEHAEHNIATVMNLADCREKNGQFASAWALFLEAESQTRSDPTKQLINTTAKNRESELEPRLSYLTISVPEESRIEGLVISRDGAPIDIAEWNRAIPVDGGEHEITGKAPGCEPWSTKITTQAEHDKQSVEVPKFKELPKLVVPVRGSTTAPPEPSLWTTRRKVGLGVAVAGVAIAGVATYFALDARSLHSDALSTCPASACTVGEASDAQDKNDRARRHALYANVGYGAAGAAVAAGVVLWLVGAPEHGVVVTPSVTDGGAGATVVGRF